MILNYKLKRIILFLWILVVLGFLLFVFNNKTYADVINNTDFVITVNTANAGSSASNQFTLPTAWWGYNYNVDWNNDGVADQTWLTTSVTRTFATAGIYKIRISGVFPRIYFNNGWDKLKILSVDQWGTGIWTSMQWAFYGCANMVVNATDAPNLTNVTDMSYIFGNTKINNNINNWNTENVTNMSYAFTNTPFNQSLSWRNVSRVTNFRAMFNGASGFNQNISMWNTSSGINMGAMFNWATSFNQPIWNWNVSNVTDMWTMFWWAKAFNQSLSGWDTSNVTTMSYMFNWASSFNQYIGWWNTSTLADIGYMFANASSFNNGQWTGQSTAPLNWDTSKVINMNYAFQNTKAFNQPIGNWDVSNVTTMAAMFQSASVFNQPIWTRNTANVTTMASMFNLASVFNQPLSNWDTSKVTNMSSMFQSASAFNQPIGIRNTASVTNMNSMFNGASAFNQPIGSWNTSNVNNMSSMFQWASIFNQPIGTWDTSKVTLINQMFQFATRFNQPIGSWEVSKATSFLNMFYWASSFNQNISNWNTSSGTNMWWMFWAATVFNNGQWTGQSTSPLNWDTSNVTTMAGMFANTKAFNQPIGTWNVGKVIDMNNMFAWASIFNQSIWNWDVSKVVNMQQMFLDAVMFNNGQWTGQSTAPLLWNTANVTNIQVMFNGAKAFNQPVNSWNTSKVTTMVAVFANASSFNQPLSNWDTSNVLTMGNMTWYGGMFANATSFNQDISMRNTAKVTDMWRMFLGASKFNQNLWSWDLTKIWSWGLQQFLQGAAMSINNYDASLIWWSQRTWYNTWVITTITARYCNGSGARTGITSTYNWTINDLWYACSPIITITSPTKLKKSAITDTTIVVTTPSPLTISATWIIIDTGITTAWYTWLNCVQTTTTKVTCTLSITSGGNIGVYAVDNLQDYSTWINTWYIIDSTPPVIMLSGLSTVVVGQWKSFSDDWATWIDNIDGSWFIVTWVASGAILNTNIPWQYYRIYTYMDAVGNTWNIATRTIIVVPAPVINIIAPTVWSSWSIADTEIIVDWSGWVYATGVFIDSGTTAAVSDLICTQITSQRVECTINVNSSGVLRIKAVDRLETEWIASEWNYIVDEIPPSVPNVSVDTLWAYNINNPQIMFSSLDNIAMWSCQVQYVWDDSITSTVSGSVITVTPAISPMVLSLDPDEVLHTVKVRCYDWVGNYSENIIKFPPIVNFTTPTQISNVSIENATVTITSPQDNNLDSITLSSSMWISPVLSNCVWDGWDTDGSDGYESPVTCEVHGILESGTIQISARDVVTNGVWQNSVSFIIDTVSPIVNIIAPTLVSHTGIINTTIEIIDDVWLYATWVTMSWLTTAPYSNFTCVQTNATKVTCSVTIENDWDIAVQALDRAWNIKNDQQTWYIIDTVLPVISLTKDVSWVLSTWEEVVVYMNDDMQLNTGSAMYGYSADNICDGDDSYSEVYSVWSGISIIDESYNSKYLCFMVKDWVGNTSYKWTSYPLQIDVTWPSLTALWWSGSRQSSWSYIIGTGEIWSTIVIYNTSWQVLCTSTILWDGTYSCGSLGILEDWFHDVVVKWKDSIGNESTGIVLSILIDNTPPVITLIWNETVRFEKGSIYVDSGAIWIDNIDGDITMEITTWWLINMWVVGNYTLLYEVQDSAGNKAIAKKRTVVIYEKSQWQSWYAGWINENSFPINPIVLPTPIPMPIKPEVFNSTIEDGVCYTRWMGDTIDQGNTVSMLFKKAHQLMYSYKLTKWQWTLDYNPDLYITREQAAKFMIEFARNILCRSSLKDQYLYTNQFIDLSKADTTLVPYIKASYEYGIFKWDPDGHFRPKSLISKDELSAIIVRMVTNKVLPESSDVNWASEYKQKMMWYTTVKRTNMRRSNIAEVIYDLYKNNQYTWTNLWYVIVDGTYKK